MRIIAGTYGGIPLEAPAGDATRPTTDRMRESLMSRIASERGGFEDARVLDAFSGSGALGLEALSRGARFCLFCERDRRALRALRSNIDRMAHAGEHCAVYAGDVFKRAARGFDRTFDLVFLDPPYDGDKGPLTRLLEALTRGALSDDALICYEYRRGDERAQALLETVGLNVVSTRSFAQTTIALARVSSRSDSAGMTGRH